MDIFWRLVLAHLLADFTFQTDYVNRIKRSGFAGMMVHVLTHAVVSAVLVREYLGAEWFRVLGFSFNGWLALSVLTAVHFAVDEIRVYVIRRLAYRDNTFNFLADQFAHFYFIFMFSPFNFSTPAFVPEKWVFLLSCLVMTTHFSTVLFYFVEKDMSGASFPAFDQKYFMIFERTIIWAFFLIPGLWWLGFLALWLVQLFYVKRKRIIDMSPLNFYGSIFSSVIFGLLSRRIYYGL